MMSKQTSGKAGNERIKIKNYKTTNKYNVKSTGI